MLVHLLDICTFSMNRKIVLVVLSNLLVKGEKNIGATNEGDSTDFLDEFEGIWATEKLNEDADNLRDMLETIIRNQNEHSFILKDIRQRITSYYSEGEVDEKNLMGLDFQLPCENLESLVDLEVYVSSHMGQFIKLIEKIGGDDGRDYTYRCLKTLFTNSLGEICSWTGQKSNYAVGHLKLLELVFDVVHRKTNCTKKEFEFYTKEWFRHSKQRREREDKRKEK